MIEFRAWHKIPRLENETYTVTEKIDGTNACIVIQYDHTEGSAIVKAQSRTRFITPEDDNFGFARWVEENKTELLKLGEGYHYGEWWGKGIQRGYGIDQKRFSLFAWWTPEENLPECCHRIPLIHNKMSLEELKELRLAESLAAPGFTRVEGVVAKSNSSNQLYKVIWDKS